MLFPAWTVYFGWICTSAFWDKCVVKWDTVFKPGSNVLHLYHHFLSLAKRQNGAFSNKKNTCCGKTCVVWKCVLLLFSKDYWINKGFLWYTFRWLCYCARLVTQPKSNLVASAWPLFLHGMQNYDILQKNMMINWLSKVRSFSEIAKMPQNMKSSDRFRTVFDSAVLFQCFQSPYGLK